MLLEVLVAGLTILALGSVLRSLLDPETRARNRFSLLRSRVRRTVIDSTRERVGNTVLLGQLGPGNRIDTFQYLTSRSLIENYEQGYTFVDAPRMHWVSDIQLDELAKFGERLDFYARERLNFALREASAAGAAGVAGGMPGSRGVRSMAVRNVYLLKRYREEIPSDTTFYGKQRSILALPADLAKTRRCLPKSARHYQHIFRFTLEEPSSAVVRREMQGTKDQLGHAIRDHALGTIEELRQTYLQIAEEFLTLLVELGGGYTAEQAQKERSSFGSWSDLQCT